MSNHAPIAVEIIWFTPSEEYLADPEKMLAPVGKISSEAGMIAAKYGLDSERQRTAVWVFGWQSLAHHRRFLEGDHYVDAMLPILGAIIGPSSGLTQIVLDDSSEFLQVISCLHTQFIYITALPPHHDHLAPIVATLKRLHQSLPGCCGSSWGTSVNGDVQVGMVGWRSIEDCARAFTGELAPTIKLLKGLSRLEIRYTTLNPKPSKYCDTENCLPRPRNPEDEVTILGS
ncbi:uncharacterized protein LACBIDRAFT_332589 [Laccaria bicolor S238N-H82]|uniref:Predicted protein n=1 Tax=Laccaria bicolor (strain S238N-H82 / ATCC MYA-4686) TaxID=486041 RepID=B0DT98_LACBS|nr:uncharacterized protein LACBIDRAFT_332589 [Laccaria bicolor S238N-H82]EDR02240.1 predicted protein [Laccaria bicolor S238N-H82]|eukprot:XP_001887185.1 predicted protein [Laccaria bicolor S238N-H82]